MKYLSGVEIVFLTLLGIAIALLASWLLQRLQTGVRRSDQIIAVECSALNNSSVAMWKQRSNGAVSWANTAYLSLAGIGSETVPELPTLFDTSGSRVEYGESFVSKLRGTEQSFDIFPPIAGGHGVYCATPLRDPAINLGAVIKNLQVGLMFFDHDQRAYIHNPALLKLTGLTESFMSARPTLRAVLDQMHDRRMIPEPREYKQWRNKLIERLQPGFDGVIEEDWLLPNSRTYRFTSASYGAHGLSVQFKDVTSEVSLSRHFQNALNTAQNVLDSQETAIAVVDANGLLVLTNAVYKDLWKHDPESELNVPTDAELLDHWIKHSEPAEFWKDVQTCFGSFKCRDPIHGLINAHSTGSVAVTLTPLADGATVISFLPERMSHQSNRAMPDELLIQK